MAMTITFTVRGERGRPYQLDHWARLHKRLGSNFEQREPELHLPRARVVVEIRVQWGVEQQWRCGRRMLRSRLSLRRQL